MDVHADGRKTVALIAHDHCKVDLVEWAEFNKAKLAAQHLVATATTGTLLEYEVGLRVQRVQSGPLGGDLQIGALLTEGMVDMLIFFWDPLEAQPHDPDVRALLRVAVVWNVPVACNRATADFLLSAPLLSNDYQRRSPQWGIDQSGVRRAV